MARLSPAQQLDLLSSRATKIQDLHQRREAIDKEIRDETRVFVTQGHRLGLNNADLARLIKVSPEAIRQVAKAIGSINPRGYLRRRSSSAA